LAFRPGSSPARPPVTTTAYITAQPARHALSCLVYAARLPPPSHAAIKRARLPKAHRYSAAAAVAPLRCCPHASRARQPPVPPAGPAPAYYAAPVRIAAVHWFAVVVCSCRLRAHARHGRRCVFTVHRLRALLRYTMLAHGQFSAHMSTATLMPLRVSHRARYVTCYVVIRRSLNAVVYAGHASEQKTKME